ncbi:tetratricopeptide repeat protein [Hymenobacter humi]|uniref:Tetratricopeptide repeat protein n=1 Tax=Hymenobacter humi TaxID=1411620 RepID=A0ABW2U2N5_9BACT
MKSSLPFVRNMLQNALREEKDFDALEKLLLTATQEHPDQGAYSELLLWLQVQRRDFTGALVQARALDRRGRTEGARVMELAAIAQQNKDYESAIDGYAYVAKEYRGGAYGNVARQRLLQAREAQVRETYPVDEAKVRALVTDYEQPAHRAWAARPTRRPCSATWPTCTLSSSTTGPRPCACCRKSSTCPAPATKWWTKPR